MLTTEEEKTDQKTYVNTDGIRKQVVGFGISTPKINKKKAKEIFIKSFLILKINFSLF